MIHTAEVAVKSESTNGVNVKSAEHIGKLKITAPNSITVKKPNVIIWEESSCLKECKNFDTKYNSLNYFKICCKISCKIKK